MTAAAEGASTRKSSRRVSRHIGTVMAVAGLVLLVWSGVVWKWGDPITALYTSWEQRKLDDELARLIADRPAAPSVVAGAAHEPEDIARRVRRDATRFRTSVAPGKAIGRLEVPALGVDMVMVEGTGSGDLKRGPGRDARTYMPGEGKLVYIAGHRTTYSAPFAHIDRLERGDRLRLEMPYATVVYVVTRHRIVDDEDLSVLRSGPREEVALQACHPRFFASQRYIVWARPVEITPHGGEPVRLSG
jgi:sortase A